MLDPNEAVDGIIEVATPALVGCDNGGAFEDTLVASVSKAPHPFAAGAACDGMAVLVCAVVGLWYAGMPPPKDVGCGGRLAAAKSPKSSSSSSSSSASSLSAK